ncbi:hypothetical protein [Paracoccus methylarcula]|nr:hypothetical protein [Paracoccus methylarcula]
MTEVLEKFTQIDGDASDARGDTELDPPSRRAGRLSRNRQKGSASYCDRVNRQSGDAQPDIQRIMETGSEAN